MSNSRPNSVCRDCGATACYRITSITIRGGGASIFDVCRTHATEYQPRRASTASGGRPGIVEVPITVRALSEAIGHKFSEILQALARRESMLTIRSTLDEHAVRDVAVECRIALKVRVMLPSLDSDAS